MFKSIYDFTKVFSVLFFINGFFFIFKEAYVVAFIMMGSFFIIRVADSDLAFEFFKFKNHCAFVITLTFFFMFLNGFLLVNEMMYSPCFYQFSKAEKEVYTVYEDSLFKTMKPCLDSHNYMMNAINNSTKIPAEYEERTNANCAAMAQYVENIEVPYEMSGVIKDLSTELKEDFIGLSNSLSNFHYFKPNNSIVLKNIKRNHTNIITNIIKIRKIMGITDELDEERRNFIIL